MKTITYKEWQDLPFKEKCSFTGIIKWGNTTQYREDGFYHRIDGPALIWTDGTEQYWIKGWKYTKEEWDKHLEVKMYMIRNSKEFKDVVKYKTL